MLRYIIGEIFGNRGGEYYKISEIRIADNVSESRTWNFSNTDIPTCCNWAILFIISRDSSVGIVTDWKVGIWFPIGARIVSLLHGVLTGSESCSTSYRTHTKGSVSGVKAGGASSWLFHLVPRSKMMTLYLNSHTRPRGVVLNLWNTGKTLLCFTFMCLLHF
jgi:hypothetical protein